MRDSNGEPVAGVSLEARIVTSTVASTGRGTSDAEGVRGRAGAPLPGVLVQVYAPTSRITIASQTTDDTGSYAVDGAPGSYRLLLAPAQGLPPTGTPDQGWSFQASRVAVVGDTNTDIDLPLARIDGVVTDENGVPVPRVTLVTNAAQREPDASLGTGSSRATTANDGDPLLLRGRVVRRSGPRQRVANGELLHARRRARR
ncbi:MAG TPA: hypothetical protein VMG12_36860 [Polyangiaceae bacterium]|nr:hypothetical protein [Polyangiaceae bacterium]